MLKRETRETTTPQSPQTAAVAFSQGPEPNQHHEHQPATSTSTGFQDPQTTRSSCASAVLALSQVVVLKQLLPARSGCSALN